MATYNNQYQVKVTPNKPTLRGIDTNYSNDGQTDLGGIGLGDLYKLDYDRNKIEQIFNQGTDAQYALMQKENQIAQNNYANNQFNNQQNAIETLRAQRNNQISSGMARGLNAAQEQGTILGLQQESAQGALDLANQQQLEADKIAAEYAANVAKALKEANAVKEAMAQVGSKLYEADMLGYTGELSAMGQMDKNASDRYGYELGLEGTKYGADKALEGTKYNADKNLEGTKYGADKNLEGTRYTADKNYAGALAQAEAHKAAASISAAAGKGEKETESLLDKGLAEGVKKGFQGNELVNFVQNYLTSHDSSYNERSKTGELWGTIDQYVVNKGFKDQTREAWLKKQPQTSTTKTSRPVKNPIAYGTKGTLNHLKGVFTHNPATSTQIPSWIIAEAFKQTLSED